MQKGAIDIKNTHGYIKKIMYRKKRIFYEN